MARKVVPLTDTQCSAAKPREKDYKLFDGQGLFLLVKRSGVKSWRLKYKKPDGRETTKAFGDYPVIGLKAARALRLEALEQLAQGVDPVEQRRAARAAVEADELGTFRAVALEWHRLASGKWSTTHSKNVLGRLERYLLPVLGNSPVTELRAADLLLPLQAAEKADNIELAGRLRQYTTNIMRLAVQQGLIAINPAGDLQGAVGARKAIHRPAIPLSGIPLLLERLDAYKGRLLTRLAVHFALLTFVRSSEMRFARWSEFDFDACAWVIPGERQPIAGVKHSERGAKMGTAHHVPLSRQAMTVLNQIRQLTAGSELVFTGDHYHWRPMSENTINAALRRMGYDTKTELCGHGFRTLASSALYESGLFGGEAIERQLSHQERNSVKAAYIHRAEHMDERRALCQWWADYLDVLESGYIPPYEYAKNNE